MECDSIESETSIKVLISRLRKLGFKIENKKNLGYKIKRS
jgi:biotin operon repressor